MLWVRDFRPTAGGDEPNSVARVEDVRLVDVVERGEDSSKRGLVLWSLKGGLCWC
jgi:hypothetical protein